MKWKVPLFEAKYRKKEIDKVANVLKSGWVSFGRECISFEKELCNFLKVPFAVFTSSATSGLHIAYKALGIETGDEVLVPSFTFIATVEPLVHLGAKPIFVDIESIRVPLLDLKDAQKKITKKTKALVFMHYAGYLRDMKPVVEFCKDNKIFLVEDSAHAFGVQRNGKFAGTFGDAGIFSFFANKNLPIGEGGAVVTHKKKLHYEMKLSRSHGIRESSWERFLSGNSEYIISHFGFNYRPTEIQGALAREKLKNIKKDIEKREKIVKEYREELKEFFVIPFDKTFPSSHYIFPVFVKDKKQRKELILHLRKKGIQTSYHYKPLHLFKIFRDNFPVYSLPVTEEAGNLQLTLPLYPQMSQENVRRVIKVIRGFF